MPRRLSVPEIQSRLPKDSLFTIIGVAEIRICSNGSKLRIIECLCQCGKVCKVRVADLLNGNNKSCGCFRKSLPKSNNLKYTPFVKGLYSRWYNMLERCYNPDNIKYNDYGGRGVKVCDEWRYNYQNFLDWALKNGYQKDLQLDKDIKGDGMLYGPDTCIWVTRAINMRHTRSSVRYDFNGRKATLPEISEESGVPMHILTDRIYAGKKTIDQAVSIPIKKYKIKTLQITYE